MPSFDVSRESLQCYAILFAFCLMILCAPPPLSPGSPSVVFFWSFVFSNRPSSSTSSLLFNLQVSRWFDSVGVSPRPVFFSFALAPALSVLVFGKFPLVSFFPSIGNNLFL